MNKVNELNISVSETIRRNLLLNEIYDGVFAERLNSFLASEGDATQYGWESLERGWNEEAESYVNELEDSDLSIGELMEERDYWVRFI